MTRRTNELIEKRDRKVYERYVYWTETQRLRIDDTIKHLSQNEFFLGERSIYNILRSEMKKAEEAGKPVPRQKIYKL